MLYKKEKVITRTHLEMRESCLTSYIRAHLRKEKRGMPRMMMLDDIKADESYEKIKRRAMGLECKRDWMPRACVQAKHDDEK